jgi:beta-galactosidase
MRQTGFKILFIVALVLARTSFAEAQSRQRQLFDFGWKFNQGDFKNAQEIDFNDSSWSDVDLPHDWSIGGEIAADNLTGGAGGFFPAGVGWYRKTFSVPHNWAGKQVAIEFEGVYMNSDVWINGQKLGNHPYGYTPFCYDLTPHLKIGDNNTIAVRLDNSRYVNSRWYSGSGIYRHVWIHVEDPIHLAPWGIHLTTPSITRDKADGVIQVTLRNDSNAQSVATVSTDILSPEDQNVAKVDTVVSIPAGAEKTIDQTFEIAKPSLWSPDMPRLYSAVSTVRRPGGSDGIYETKFGIRSIKVSAENGFELNGQTIKLCGGCVHHDNGCLGAEAFDRAEQRKVELLKEAGFDAVRTSHNPPSPAFLDACDRLGMLVIDEAFDCWDQQKASADYSGYFDDWWQRDLDAMMLRDRNHPSVVIWSLGNELPQAGTPDGLRVGSMLADRVRSLDSTRPLTAGIFWYNGIHAADGSRWRWTDVDPLFAKLDIAGYNYQLWAYRPDHARVPSRVMLATESFLKDTFKCWQLTQQSSYLAGDFVWSAMDYLGESGIGRYYLSGEQIIGHGRDEQYPYHGASCGDMDITGFRKPISHYRNIVWDRGEKLYTTILQPSPDGKPYRVEDWGLAPSWASWTWPGVEGRNLSVQVFSRYDRVQLYLNDKLIGEKPTTKDEQFKAVFDVPYAPGVLRTVGLNEGRVGEQNILKTAGASAQVRLTADRLRITADGQDLCFFTVETIDKAGDFQPNGDQLVTFNIIGPGVIAGIGSGDYSQAQMYQGAHRLLFRGRAEVVIRSARAAGTITLTAAAPGLTAGSIDIESRTPVAATSAPQ